MFDYAHFIQLWSQQVSPHTRELAELFVCPDRRYKRYLFGCNHYAVQLSNEIPIDGFVDDYAPPSHTLNNKPVIHSNALPANALVVNCVSSIHPVAAARKLQSLPIAGSLAASDLYRCYPEQVSLPTFVAETRADLQHHGVQWNRLISLVTDAPSRKVLMDLLQFRLTGDIDFMTDYRYRPNEQYFEDFLNLGAGDVFVDAGGFTGDTTEAFCTRYPDYRKVFLFEPSPANIEQAKQRLAQMRDIHLIPFGVSSSEGVLRFDPHSGSASSVSVEGSLEINVTTIDHQIQEKTTFIKMDLEGWELEALKGARRHIREDRPKLAIAVYHHAADFWRIPEYVLGLRDDYQIALGHYTEGWSETVMYFM